MGKDAVWYLNAPQRRIMTKKVSTWRAAIEKDSSSVLSTIKHKRVNVIAESSKATNGRRLREKKLRDPHLACTKRRHGSEQECSVRTTKLHSGMRILKVGGLRW